MPSDSATSDTLPTRSGRARTGWLCLLCGLMSCVQTASAVVNGAEVPSADRRFDAVGLLLTGPAPATNCGGSVSGSCVLIAPQMVLTARHVLTDANGNPLPPGTYTRRVRFRRTPDGRSGNSYPASGCDDAFQEIPIVQEIWLPGSGIDLAIGILASPVINIQPVQVDPVPPAPGSQITIAGWGFAGECLGSGPAWQLRSASGLTPHGIEGQLLTLNSCSMSPCVNCAPGAWAIPNLHDSGAPVFSERPCGNGPTELRLVGIVMTPTYAFAPGAWAGGGGTPPLPTALECGGCLADVNADGQLTAGDLFAFLGDWFARLPEAEFDGQPGITVQDVFDYLDAFFGGC